MTEWIITSCALIGILLLLRLLLKRRISMRLRYGLWLLVLLRLLIPLSFPSSLSIMNLFPEAAVPEQPSHSVSSPAPQRPSVETPTALPIIRPLQPQQSAPVYQQPVNAAVTQPAPPIAPKTLLLCFWIVGMVVTGSIFIISNIHFALRLKRSRKKLDISCCVPVYQSTILSTPCIHGVLFPKLYLPGVPKDNAQLQHILAHETAHLHQLDHIWSLLRCICLVIHWYNPLVWLAAVLSRQDAELACDEIAVRRLGEAQRSAYGQTLIQITCTKNPAKDLFLTASTMLVTKKSLKERIIMIAKKPKTTLIAFLIVILTAIIAVSCTFTGANEKTPSSQEPPDTSAISFQEEANTYIRFNGGFGGDFTITLYEDGRFKYYEGNLSSYIGYGNWTLTDGILTLNDDNQNLKFSNSFRVEKDKLIWLAAKSTGFTYGDYISMADGDIFFLQSPKPAQLSYMTDLAYLPQDYMDGGPLGCFLHVDGITYVWDHNVTGTLQDMQAEEIGSVAHRDDTVIPETQLTACRIPKGTVLYKGKDAGKSKYEAIYYKLEGFDLYARMLPTDAYRGADRWWERQTMHDVNQPLTVDTLRKIQEEKGKLLSRADLTQYGHVTFSVDANALEYHLFQVDTDYRLLLVSAATNTDVEALQARFYHKDLPHYWVDLMTTDIDLYQSHLTANELETISEKEVVFDLEGFVTVESLENRTPCRITLEKNREGARHLNTQLVVTSPAGTLRQIISPGIGPVIPDGEKLYLADLDGDSVCEIILQEDLGGIGGCGTYRCRVFKVDNNTITVIFDVDPDNDFNTGFYWEICDNFKFVIHNRITGDSWKFDADGYMKSYYFNDAGKAVDSAIYPLEIDSFYEFYPKDVDSDGIYELCTTQYAFAGMHVDGIGDAKCVLKYDKNSGRFLIIETDFVPYEE